MIEFHPKLSVFFTEEPAGIFFCGITSSYAERESSSLAYIQINLLKGACIQIADLQREH